jgi:hypothetical protein
MREMHQVTSKEGTLMSRIAPATAVALLLALPAAAPAAASSAAGHKSANRTAHHRPAPRQSQHARPKHRAHSVSFYARVVRSSARGLTVRTSAGKIVAFSARQIKRAGMPKRHKHRNGRAHGFQRAFDLQVSSGNVVVNILGLQPGVLVQITETTDADGNVTITITLPPPSGEESASGVVTELDSDAFLLQAGDGSQLRLHMSEGALSNLHLQTCDTVEVSYHQDAGILIADTVSNTGTSTSGDCTPTQDATGEITQVSADSLTINGEQGPVTFTVDPSSGLTGGYQVGDLVDVTYTQSSDGTLNATNVQFVEEDTSGPVTSVTTSAHGGSLTITDDNNGQSETFHADPANGVQINAHAFNGVSVGDQIELSYHQSAGQLVADTVTEQ